MVAPRLRGPGIAKVRHPRPQAYRVARLTRADDGLWARLFEGADILSEGAVDREGGGELVYRGTTSIILTGSSNDCPLDSFQLAELAQAAMVDPHARLRAVRIARREAQVRAPGALEPAQMDVVIRLTDAGIRIDVEVDALVAAPAVDVRR